MDDVETLKAAYNFGLVQRFWIRLCCLCKKRENQMLDLRLINNVWPDPKIAILPDNLIWENISVAKVNQILRLVISWLVMLLLLIGAFYALFSLSTK